MGNWREEKLGEPFRSLIWHILNFFLFIVIDSADRLVLSLSDQLFYLRFPLLLSLSLSSLRFFPQDCVREEEELKLSLTRRRLIVVGLM